MTRGKRLVVLVGQRKAVAIAVRNVSGRRRWSKLDEWLAATAMRNRRKVWDGLIMVVSNLDIHQAARLHRERLGDEAVAKARDMVRNVKERGDNEAADTWLRIIVASEVSQHRSAT